MPRLVDHQQRRLDIIAAAWRTLAREGVEATTMRKIAEEAGFANGALGHYFTSKDELLAAAYSHVYAQTYDRIGVALESKSGVEALSAFCYEILPADEEKLLEARIVIPFWERALTRSEDRELHEHYMQRWKADLARLVGSARSLGEVRTPLTDEQVAGQVLAMLTGWQVLALLAPNSTSSPVQRELLDAFINALT